MCGTDVLYEVKKKEMRQRMHRFMVAIVWRRTKHGVPSVGRGSGVLISPNLILTVAHNFFHNRERVENLYFELFIGQRGKL